MNFTTLAKTVGQDVLDLPLKSVETQRQYFLDLSEKVSQTSGLREWLAMLVTEEMHLLAVVKEDDCYWTGVVELGRSWIAVEEEIPFVSHPEINSIGCELAFECLGSVRHPSDMLREAALTWLRHYQPMLAQMEDEIGELYIDAVIQATKKGTAGLLTELDDALPSQFEYLRARIQSSLG